jgi:hypothetical protein
MKLDEGTFFRAKIDERQTTFEPKQGPKSKSYAEIFAVVATA